MQKLSGTADLGWVQRSFGIADSLVLVQKPSGIAGGLAWVQKPSDNDLGNYHLGMTYIGCSRYLKGYWHADVTDDCPFYLLNSYQPGVVDKTARSSFLLAVVPHPFQKQTCSLLSWKPFAADQVGKVSFHRCHQELRPLSQVLV